MVFVIVVVVVYGVIFKENLSHIDDTAHEPSFSLSASHWVWICWRIWGNTFLSCIVEPFLCFRSLFDLVLLLSFHRDGYLRVLRTWRPLCMPAAFLSWIRRVSPFLPDRKLSRENTAHCVSEQPH